MEIVNVFMMQITALISVLAFCCFFAMMFRMRGDGFSGWKKIVFNDFMAAVYIGIASLWMIEFAPYTCLAVWSLWFLYTRFGWGVYMVSFSGDLDTLFVREDGFFVRKNGNAMLDSEVRIVEILADKTYKLLKGEDFRKNLLDWVNEWDIESFAQDKKNEEKAMLWGLIAMFYRQLMIAPVFIALAYINNSPAIALFSLSCAATSAFIYYAARDYYRNVVVRRHNEWIMSNIETKFIHGTNQEIIKLPTGDPPENKILFYIEHIVGFFMALHIAFAYFWF